MAESIRRSYREFVGAVADTLDSLNIEYGIAGSFASGWKADCYFLRNTAYDRAAFARRREWPLQVMDYWQKLWNGASAEEEDGRL